MHLEQARKQNRQQQDMVKDAERVHSSLSWRILSMQVGACVLYCRRSAVRSIPNFQRRRGAEYIRRGGSGNICFRCRPCGPFGPVRPRLLHHSHASLTVSLFGRAILAALDPAVREVENRASNRGKCS